MRALSLGVRSLARRRLRTALSVLGIAVAAALLLDMVLLSGGIEKSFAELVLEEAAVIVSPGSMYGPSGEGFFRISLTAPDERIEEAVERLREHLK
jgi:LL-diaminopimelate aminotransferase